VIDDSREDGWVALLFSAGYGLLSLGSCLFDCEVLVLRYETHLTRVIQLEVCMAGVLL
jgi:hypothetical protein